MNYLYFYGIFSLLNKLITMSAKAWEIKNCHKDWYYYRLQIVYSETPDELTWKLQILKVLQQAGGVFGQAIDFDILTTLSVHPLETIVRVAFEDHKKFTEYISMGVFDEEKNPGSFRIIAKSASLQGVVTDATNWIN